MRKENWQCGFRTQRGTLDIRGWGFRFAALHWGHASHLRALCFLFSTSRLFFVLFSSKQSIFSDLSAHPWFKSGSCVRATLHSWQQSCARLTRVPGCWWLPGIAETSLPMLPLWTLTLVSSHNPATGHLGNLCYLLNMKVLGHNLTQSVSLVIPDLDDKFCMRHFCLSVHSHNLSGKPFGRFIHHTRLCRKTIL